jgi:hypothetical protein
MKASELRIGNWLMFRNMIMPETYTQVDPRFFRSFIIGDGLEVSGYYHGIPLTPEILVKCGFVLVNHIHGYSFYTMDRRSKNDKSKPAIDVYENKTQFMGCSVNYCQYLHQLQNLYFALTGSELEVNL